MDTGYVRICETDVHPNDHAILDPNQWHGRCVAVAYALGFLRGVKVAQHAVRTFTSEQVLFAVLAQNIRARAAVTGDSESGL